MNKSEQERLYVWLGQKIQSIRTSQKLSQTELGMDVGLSRSSIVNIERGYQHAPLHIYFHIAEVLKIPYTDLLPLNNEHLNSAEQRMINNTKNTNYDESVRINFESFIKENLNHVTK